MRNHAAILAAAERLFAETDDGPGVSTEDIAAAAGVGKGTIFRAFGDRAGLLRAVYDARVETLRATSHDSGSPASPRDQVHALLQGVVQAKIAHRQLVLALEDATGQRKAETLFESPPYQWVHGTLQELLGPLLEERMPPAWVAHVLLSALRADLLEHLLTNDAMTKQEILDSIRLLVDQILGPAT
ncbi:TetR/AcrR family transcriptional regulator [Acrocarpospora catenulata]|uniref:TetR/AcrR family transcriptional regulator n=1 Tax=Acrocarpospora catenulata TaxID=2836182 RepID=UPI001BD9F194|nr:TetR/AcrR family transcriptional regulator [Acrocarpospora catenulata]